MPRRISSLNYVEFFAEALADPDRARDLYTRAYNTSDTAKVILHQTARLVSLADWMDEAAPARPALKILFFLIVAEAVAKMAAGYMEEGQSRVYVHRFFEELCLPQDLSRLAHAFRGKPGFPHRFLTAPEAVDVLYDVRCSVAHRGEYFVFHLSEPNLPATMTSVSSKGGTVQALITAEELRSIVIRGAVAAAEQLT